MCLYFLIFGQLGKTRTTPKQLITFRNILKCSQVQIQNQYQSQLFSKSISCTEQVHYQVALRPYKHQHLISIQTQISIIQPMGCLNSQQQKNKYTNPNASRTSQMLNQQPTLNTQMNSQIDSDNQMEYEKGLPKDQLYQVSQLEMMRPQHGTIGVIEGEYIPQNSLNGKSVKVYGTACQISKDLIISCAHNFYDNLRKCYYKNFVFYPGIKGVLQNGIQILCIFFPPQFKEVDKKSSQLYDYAFCKLKSANPLKQYLPLLVDFKSYQDEQIKIFGYPTQNFVAADQTCLRKKVSQYGQSAIQCITKISVKTKCIKHTLITSFGQSGSPIIINYNNRLMIIGIHLAFLKNNDQIKIGRLIEQQYKNKLMEFVERNSCSKFQYYLIQQSIVLGITQSKNKFQWNTTQSTGNYAFQPNVVSRIKRLQNNALEQIVSLRAVSKTDKQIVSIKLNRYLTCVQIGLITAQLITINYKDQVGSFSFWTSKGLIGVVGGCGSVYIDGKGITLHSSYLYAQQGNTVNLTVDYPNSKAFINIKQTGIVKQLKFPDSFKGKQLYVFLLLNDINDSVQMLC